MQRGAQANSAGYGGLRAGEGLNYGAAVSSAAAPPGAARLVTGLAATGGSAELGSAQNPVYTMQVSHGRQQSSQGLKCISYGCSCRHKHRLLRAAAAAHAGAAPIKLQRYGEGTHSSPVAHSLQAAFSHVLLQLTPFRHHAPVYCHAPRACTLAGGSIVFHA